MARAARARAAVLSEMRDREEKGAMNGESDHRGLVVNDVSVTFGGLAALDQVSLVVEPGEVVGVIGPNGAGKTTLFNVICGFVKPTSGTISYKGRELRSRPHDLSSLGIARTLQGVGLWRGLTVLENVMAGAQATLKAGLVSALFGLWRSSREETRLHDKAIGLLGELSIGEYAVWHPSALPYAIQKKVALARALASEPTLLLLDEPASGMSSTEMGELHDLVLGLRGTRGVLLVEHHMDFVMSVCDRLVVLNFGRVIAAGPPEQIRADPQVTTAYLGEEVRHPETLSAASASHKVSALAGHQTVVSDLAGGGETRAEGGGVLEVEGLSASYDAIKALEDVSLEAERGAITAVLGANGAGKTTLLRTISGLVKPTSGNVQFEGVTLTGMAVEDIVRQGVAHVPEGRGVIHELTVEENLSLGALWGTSRAKVHAAMDDVYQTFPVLRDKRRDNASTLSGGERQMLAIGRALVSKPRLLLLDEPSLGLAPVVTAQFMAVLRELTEASELTVVLVEQNARSALSVAEHAVVINLGKVVMSDTAQAVGADSDLRHHYLGF